MLSGGGLQCEDAHTAKGNHQLLLGHNPKFQFRLTSSLLNYILTFIISITTVNNEIILTFITPVGNVEMTLSKLSSFPLEMLTMTLSSSFPIENLTVILSYLS